VEPACQCRVCVAESSRADADAGQGLESWATSPTRRSGASRGDRDLGCVKTRLSQRASGAQADHSAAPVTCLPATAVGARCCHVVEAALRGIGRANQLPRQRHVRALDLPICGECSSCADDVCRHRTDLLRLCKRCSPSSTAVRTASACIPHHWIICRSTADAKPGSYDCQHPARGCLKKRAAVLAGVIVISHNVAFVNALCNEWWTISPSGLTQHETPPDALTIQSQE
jgi:hypothetical protein